MNNSTTSNKKVKEGFVGQKMIVLPPNIKNEVAKNELINRFYLTNIGYYPHAHYHDRERKFGCHQYILLYCIEGSGTIKVGNDVHILNPNTYFILPKMVYHHYWSSKDDPWTIYWFHFSGKQADILYSRFTDRFSSPPAIAYDERRIMDFDDIFNLLDNSFENRDLEIINLKLINFISSMIYAKELNPSLHEDDVVTDSINYMKWNLNTQKTVSDFAKQQHLSVSHYSRLFRNKTGSSPNQYFNQLKVQKSCQYLYFSDRNIKEICVELGFDDPFYFSRLFKKLMGMSPANYKSQHKKSSDGALSGIEEV